MINNLVEIFMRFLGLFYVIIEFSCFATNTRIFYFENRMFNFSYIGAYRICSLGQIGRMQYTPTQNIRAFVAKNHLLLINTFLSLRSICQSKVFESPKNKTSTLLIGAVPQMRL